MGTIIVFTLVIGIVSTLVLDAWAQLQWKAAGIAAPNWGIAGRWVKGLSRFEFVLDSSDDHEPSHSDKIVGWAFHYLVGIAYALLIFVIWGRAFAVHPTLWPTIVIGLFASTLAGLCVFLPGLGAGFAGSKLPDRKMAITRMVVGHIVFMLGQYVAALGLSALL
ncbi:DUF2938 family protein [Salinisphaera hydrothermalis]|uniref:DUF2938 family protein n=1 Tax=Salinisphaera hydrothermalis TaxID=563188 RepID=UPI00334175AA